MDEQDRQKLSGLLQAKWTQNLQHCEICGTNKWSVADELFTPMQFTSGGISIGGKAYPQAMVMCVNCGNTKYFNSIILGFTEKKDG